MEIQQLAINNEYSIEVQNHYGISKRSLYTMNGKISYCIHRISFGVQNKMKISENNYELKLTRKNSDIRSDILSLTFVT